METKFSEFLRRYPDYHGTEAIDELRKREFSRLDRLGHIYVDYTGGGLFGDFQIRHHMEFLAGSVLGNPHSTNPTSALATERVVSCRKRVLEFFNADPEEYVLIFTSNASGALKLVGESYPFSEGDQFLLTFDNHNSVVGIRAFDRVKRASTQYIPVEPPDLRVPEERLRAFLEGSPESRNKLFAFPAQSNFSGVQHPLDWIREAQELGWDVLLDAAAFVPTNRLDLQKWHPDYVTLSFYKMFGYPTGVGALLARRPALQKLHRPWFAGGTISWASVLAESHTLSPGSDGFEDGTLNYTSLPAVELGLEFLDSVGVDTIHDRVNTLAGWLMDELVALRHSSGERVARIYGPIDTESRGGTVALNLYDSKGAPIDHRLVEEKANSWKISLRTGCFCNPGAGEMAMGLERDEIVGCLTRSQDRMTLDQFQQCIDDKSTGAVRISFGVASTFEDASKVLQFFQEFQEG
ncbi:MAG: aminotransferase class V-fold PLP-dependent enzyme [Gemmatimonadetes bacterium]|nr:aminotransferase class V-fold PLP-dependent enzyme [Gemmatimonadota bacterium]